MNELHTMTVRRNAHEHVVAVMGNPNVGKSTVFNALTGLRQHTGNWPGKTVQLAVGGYRYGHGEYRLVDLPGAYSVLAHSQEEEVARNYLCFGDADAVLVVCDATCLLRNINLVLQTLELSPRVVVCVNLMDEAKKKGIEIDLERLERLLGVPVVGASARDGAGMDQLMCQLKAVCEGPPQTPRGIHYIPSIEGAIALIQRQIEPLMCVRGGEKIRPDNARWLALRLLEDDKSLTCQLDPFFLMNEDVDRAIFDARALLQERGMGNDELLGSMVASLYMEAEAICEQAVHVKATASADLTFKLDKLLTGRRVGIPAMLLLLALTFYITIVGSNIPSEWLSRALFGLQGFLDGRMLALGVPESIASFLIGGVFRVTAWVVSVMLPPMAIFFPLFTLLEDFGYLPRIAFNLDNQFRKCNACGKQALCMAMGFGCNAAGVTGCRIIDSPRERLIAILTNSLVPCNGRFPTLILLLTIFFTATNSGPLNAVFAALGLVLLIVLGVLFTFLLSKGLSLTLLRGVPSSFTLELPPYRVPQVGQVLMRSVLDRTLFVLARAVSVAAPAGGLIWLLANIAPGGVSLIARLCAALEPAGRLMGMDGAILSGFILGFPANEIVLPIAFSIYTASGTLPEMGSAQEIGGLLTAHGWNWLTALCTMLFSLFHWPCSTTCLTIYKETKSIRWTLVGIALPTALGVLLCMSVAGIARLLGLG